MSPSRRRALHGVLHVVALLCFLAWPVAMAGTEAVDSAPSAPPLQGRSIFRFFGRDDGLDNLFVECLLQDRTGFLWIGTYDGLYRFDGRRFSRFGAAEGLPSETITALHETVDGRLFVGTESGLAERVGATFLRRGQSAGLPEDTIGYQGLASDAAGTLFVGTRRGLFAGQGTAYRLLPRGDGRPEVTAFGLHIEPSGQLVYSYADEPLVRRSGSTITSFGRKLGLTSDEWPDFSLTDADGNICVRSLRAVWVLAPGAARFERDDAGLPAAASSGRLALDEIGQLLVPTVRGLARKGTSGTWELLGSSGGLERAMTTSALVDREGNLWIGLLGGGLAVRYGGGTFTFFGRAEGLSYEAVRATAKDPQKNALWVGTEDGLNRFDLDTAHIAEVPLGDAPSQDVYALATAPDGSLWAGAWSGGVTRRDPLGGLTRPGVVGGTPADLRVRALAVDPDGTVWAGAWSGLFRKGPAEADFVRVPFEADGPRYVTSLARDADGVLWAAGAFGLLRLSAAQVERFGPGQGLRAGSIASLVPLAEGGRFAVTWEREPLGLDVLEVRNGAVTRREIASQGGRSGYPWRALGVDTRGLLWIATERAAETVDLSAASPVLVPAAPGLGSVSILRGAFHAEPSGVVWLGATRGLVRFQPDAQRRTIPPPHVVLLDARSGDRTLRNGERLPHGTRGLVVRWAAPLFQDAVRGRFRYRLEGLAGGGAETETHETEARFEALPSGTYRFRVVALSATGALSPGPATFGFVIARAWWELPGVWVLAAVLAALLLRAAYTARTRALLRDRARLEEAVAARSAQLETKTKELEEASFTDPLTGVRNRRYFAAVIAPEVARFRRMHLRSGEHAKDRKNADVVFYLVDLDHFKQVNDRYGHEAGDRVLLETSWRLSATIRQSDMLVRWGGEEFLVVSRDTEREKAHLLAERILAAISGSPFEIGLSIPLGRSASLGFAPLPWSIESPDLLSHEDILKLTDMAHYEAKRRGRNRAIGLLPLPWNGAPEDLVPTLAAQRFEALDGFVFQSSEMVGPAILTDLPPRRVGIDSGQQPAQTP